MSHGLQVGFSYTYSHSLDEQSGLGLFYNGNNPLNLRDGYASSDFDRTHIINFIYTYRFPDSTGDTTLLGRFTNGWQLSGLTVLQSGQPYSVEDLLRRRRQHLLRPQRRHHQPHRSARPGFTAQIRNRTGHFGGTSTPTQRPRP